MIDYNLTFLNMAADMHELASRLREIGQMERARAVEANAKQAEQFATLVRKRQCPVAPDDLFGGAR